MEGRDNTNFCAKSIGIVVQIIKRVLPEFTERKEVWLARFVAHSFDKFCNKFPVDMLFELSEMERIDRWEMNLDSIEPKTTSTDIVYDPFTPLDDILSDVWMTVLNISSH